MLNISHLGALCLTRLVPPCFCGCISAQPKTTPLICAQHKSQNVFPVGRAHQHTQQTHVARKWYTHKININMQHICNVGSRTRVCASPPTSSLARNPNKPNSHLKSRSNTAPDPLGDDDEFRRLRESGDSGASAAAHGWPRHGVDAELCSLVETDVWKMEY